MKKGGPCPPQGEQLDHGQCIFQASIVPFQPDLLCLLDPVTRLKRLYRTTQKNHHVELIGTWDNDKASPSELLEKPTNPMNNSYYYKVELDSQANRQGYGHSSLAYAYATAKVRLPS